MEALRSPAFYVGAIGSRANQAKRKQRLIEHFGMREAEFERLHGPVGLEERRAHATGDCDRHPGRD